MNVFVNFSFFSCDESRVILRFELLLFNDFDLIFLIKV